MHQVVAPTGARLRSRVTAFAVETGDRILRERFQSGSRGLTGAAGFALFYAALAECTGADRFAAAMHANLREGARAEDRPSIGLFDGISGLRAAAALAARSEPRYSKLVAQCDAYVEAELPKRRRKPPTFFAYDLIGGWSGALLARGVGSPVEKGRLAELVVWVLENPTRWRCPHPMRPDDPPANDVGIAHGLAGMLAAIALTLDPLEGKPERAAARTLSELRDLRVELGTHVVWPSVISPHRQDTYRSAWCYGAPGVLAAMHSAATMLRDDETVAFATNAMCAVAAQPPDSWSLEGEAICHGLMGNALCFASVASATGNATLWSAAIRIAESVMDRLDANAGKCWARDVSMNYHDAVELLDGVSGVALALLTLAGDADAAWMRLFGLRPIG